MFVFVCLIRTIARTLYFVEISKRKLKIREEHGCKHVIIRCSNMAICLKSYHVQSTLVVADTLGTALRPSFGARHSESAQ